MITQETLSEANEVFSDYYISTSSVCQALTNYMLSSVVTFFHFELSLIKILPCGIRPFRLISLVGMTFERILTDQGKEYLVKACFSLISCIHMVQGKKKSCFTSLLELFEDNTAKIACSMDIIFLDFQESFDSVLPKRLMLKERGVKGQEKSLLIKLKSSSKQEQ